MTTPNLGSKRKSKKTEVIPSDVLSSKLFIIGQKIPNLDPNNTGVWTQKKLE